MKLFGIVIALLVASGAGVMAGVVLAQDGWITELAADYAAVWRAAYDEAGRRDLPPAGRETVADRVLEAYIATNPQSGADATAPEPAPGATIPPWVVPTPTPVPDDYSDPPPEVINLPPPGPPEPVSASNVDGYTTAHSIEITTGGQMLMSVGNFHTAGGYAVILTRDGTLMTGGDGTLMEDRYEFFCGARNYPIEEKRTYARDMHKVDLPKTVLDTKPLFNHPMAVLGARICSGELAPPLGNVVIRF